MSRRAAIAAATALATGALAVASGCGGGDEPNPAITPDPAFGAQPNIVFIYTDDQDYSSFNRRVMPHTFADIVDHGSDFTNYYDATPLCCPARAGVLTGQYGHNNGVLSNKPGYGDLADNENTLPVWLQRAGYQTAIVGKFLNGYENAVDDKDDVAPGWDLWSVEIGNGRGYYDFKLAVNGHQRKEVYKGQYLTNVHQRARGGGRPPARRRPAVLPLGHPERAARREHQREQRRPVRRRGGAPAARPRPLRRHAAAATSGRARAGRLRQARDRQRPAAHQPEAAPGDPPPLRVPASRPCRRSTAGSAQIVDALRQTGELDDTILVFSSDNGTFQGQHRIPGGKGLAYEEAAHLPLADPGAAEVRGRRARRRRRSTR